MGSKVTTPYFLKGFAQSVGEECLLGPEKCKGECYAVVTDMVETYYTKIDKALKEGDMWIVVRYSDGYIQTFLEEPKTPRHMERGKLVVIYSEGLDEVDSYVIPEVHYGIVMDAINNGSRNYVLRGIVQGGSRVETSPLIKVWVDGEERHGITMSGTHYIF